MAILRVDEIRKMGKEERGKKVTELKTELSRLMTTRAMGGSLENPARIRLIRKTIAKFNTISREEELGIKRQPAEKKEKAKEKEPKLRRKAKKRGKREGLQEKARSQSLRQREEMTEAGTLLLLTDQLDIPSTLWVEGRGSLRRRPDSSDEGRPDRRTSPTLTISWLAIE